MSSVATRTSGHLVDFRREIPAEVNALAEHVSSQWAGSTYLVGGWVRDKLLGIDSKDVDVELFGLTMKDAIDALSMFGEEVQTQGKSYGVLRVPGIDIDFSLPRRDRKTGPGHGGFEIKVDPDMTFDEAAARRDLTINAIGVDALTGDIVDPWGGMLDLSALILRVVDEDHFAEDPLRGLRAARFAAKYGMEFDPVLTKMCSELRMEELPGDRIRVEMLRLLLESERPSVGLEAIRAAGMLRHIPQLEMLVGVPQVPQWHPEGDVWTHTLMVVDQAAKLKTGHKLEDEVLMWAALCHDLGKPYTTWPEDGRIRSHGHAEAGIEIARALMRRWNVSNEKTAMVEALVQHHLAPAVLPKTDAKLPAYRRLARKLTAAGVSMGLLERLARADQLGRTTPAALTGEFEAGDRFLEIVSDLNIKEEGPRDVVMGRHLIARGMQPGVEFAGILDRCRNYQDETGATDPDRILKAVLGE